MVLRAQEIQRIIVAGVSTAWAVQATARDAHDREYELVVVEDACAASTELEHRESTKLLSQIGRIVKAEDLLKL
jgi:biuret amidohydrolase